MNRPYFGRALRGLAFLTAGSIGLAHADLALAGAFSVNPVRVTLSAKQPVAAITVRNESAEQTLVQLETLVWSQSLGKDVTVPSADVLATPPIFTLQPKGSQIVRIGLRKPAGAAPNESTYRLTLREVPPKEPKPGLTVALLVSMPIFVNPAAATAPSLQWRAVRTGDSELRLQATNSGTAHAQISKIDIGAGDKSLTNRTIAEYVLPGNTRTWTVNITNAPAIGSKLRVAATTDFGESNAEVLLEKP
jgi:fimbrial chaperone protein